MNKDGEFAYSYISFQEDFHFIKRSITISRCDTYIHTHMYLYEVFFIQNIYFLIDFCSSTKIFKNIV